MAIVVFDYSKCKGKGECVRKCSLDLLELDQDGRWCKPKNDEVDDEEALKEFREKVFGKEESDAKIVFSLANCAECYSCEKFCPEQAVEVKEQ
jgi:ferredoxin